MEASYVNNPSDLAIYPHVRWIKWNGKDSLLNAVPGGQSSTGETLYVGRGKVSDVNQSLNPISLEKYTVGYIIPSLSRLFAVFESRTYQLIDFEFLSIKPSSYEWISFQDDGIPAHAFIGYMENSFVRYLGKTANQQQSALGECKVESLVGGILPAAKKLSYYKENEVRITSDYEYLILKPCVKSLFCLCVQKHISSMSFLDSFYRHYQIDRLLRWKTVLHDGEELRSGSILKSEKGLYSIEVDAQNQLKYKKHKGSSVIATQVYPYKINYFRLLLDGLHIGCVDAENGVTFIERNYPHIVTSHNNDVLSASMRIEDRNGYLRFNFITKTKRELIYVLETLDDLLE